jgi:hypothetical protein
LPVGVFRETDRAGFGDAFQSRCNVDAVAHQVAVALRDHVADVNADAELDAALGRKARVALDHPVLHLDGAADCVDHAAKLDIAVSDLGATQPAPSRRKLGWWESVWVTQQWIGARWRVEVPIVWIAVITQSEPFAFGLTHATET